MESDRPTDGAEGRRRTRAAGGDGFDEVWGSAIARAVRRAVDGVGRDPFGELEQGGNGPTVPADAPDAGEPDPELDAELDDDLPPPLPAIGTTDPYELLGVNRRAPWDEITAAYKQRARAWHPDGASEDEQPRRHELIRELNAAYAELRVRRGR